MSAVQTYDLTGQDPAWSDDRPKVTSPETGAAVLLGTGIADADVEECWVLFLNTRHALIEAEMISRGSIDHTFMSPREVYRHALMHNSAALLIAHNHPSGDPTPSNDDERVTRRLMEAGDIMGVDLLDHLVFGGTSWVSLARRGTFG